jgi:hypothetical protein
MPVISTGSRSVGFALPVPPRLFQGYQVSESGLAGEEGCRSALLHHSAASDDDDVIGFPGGGQPVGDCEHCGAQGKDMVVQRCRKEASLAPSTKDVASSSSRTAGRVSSARARASSCRWRWIGHQIHAEADLDIDGQATLVDAHHLAHAAEHRLTHDVPKLRTAAIHAYPAHTASG